MSDWPSAHVGRYAGDVWVQDVSDEETLAQYTHRPVSIVTLGSQNAMPVVRVEHRLSTSMVVWKPKLNVHGMINND